MGGYRSQVLSDAIMRLDAFTYAWSEVGEINKARLGHNVIEVGGELLVIGGCDIACDPKKQKEWATERCKFKNGKMTCKKQKPDLIMYINYPELLTVPDNCCS